MAGVKSILSNPVALLHGRAWVELVSRRDPIVVSCQGEKDILSAVQCQPWDFFLMGTYCDSVALHWDVWRDTAMGT